MKKVGRRPADTKYDYIVLGPKGEPFWWDDEGRLMTARRNGKDPHRVINGYYEEELAVPPRGKRIALSGGTSIVTASLDGGPTTRIYHSTFPGLRAVGDMSWSADGKKLVFVDYPEPEKYETPADPESHAFLYAGGSVRELPLSQEAMGGPPIFSPDATRLASTGEEGSLYVSSLDGGAPKRILQRNCTRANCLFSPGLLGWVR